MENDKYYGFSTEKINEFFEGGLTYLNTFCINNEYSPVAVYKVANPDNSKGHKKYLLLQMKDGKGLVRGMDEEEIQKWRYQDGVECLECGEILRSINRHHYITCSCPNQTMVDGGRDNYYRYGGKDTNKLRIIKIDLLKE